jgi:hypothetical protein
MVGEENVSERESVETCLANTLHHNDHHQRLSHFPPHSGSNYCVTHNLEAFKRYHVISFFRLSLRSIYALRDAKGNRYAVNDVQSRARSHAIVNLGETCFVISFRAFVDLPLHFNKRSDENESLTTPLRNAL